ncbi:hypothetical protein ABNN70_06590 [Sporolactobacillus sp. Y61]|uniref:AP2 domain-containing protein n=1 Tax=Sporolactobacillus sp. Y61 TaxID=3160863 RepID=A0AAU8IIQ6_9BACL
MRRRIDITGQRFGRLVALREVLSEDHVRRYLCQCDCGSQKVIRMYQLRAGKTKSCGCLNREITSAKLTYDLTGKRFGRLTVLHRSDKHHKSQNNAVWTCSCDCGNTIDVLSKYLLNGETKSCGCWKSDHGRWLRAYEEKRYRKNGVYVPLLRSKVRADSSTGVKGVSLIRESGKYRASLTIRGKRHYLGEFKRLEDAARARKAAEEKYYKPFLEG